MDGSLNVLDITLLIHFIVYDNQTPTAEEFSLSDLNNDGGLNVIDVVNLVNLIVGDALSRGIAATNATLYYGNGILEYESDGDIAGIQLEVTGEYSILHNSLPEGWDITNSEHTILIYSLDGSSLENKTLFEYTGDFRVESAIVADWYESTISTASIMIPKEFNLSPAYPNPFNPATTLRFALPEKVEVSIIIYNLQGRQVEALTDGYMDAGYHQVVWNANREASGMYFVQMIAGKYMKTQKLMLVK